MRVAPAPIVITRSTTSVPIKAPHCLFVQVSMRYSSVRDPQADQTLDPACDVVAHGLGELGDRLAVLHRHRQVDGRLFLADLNRDPRSLTFAGQTMHSAYMCGKNIAETIYYHEVS